MNLSSDSIVCDPLNFSLPFDSYSDVEKERWDQECNFSVDVYFETLIMEKALEKGNNIAVDQQKYAVYSNACEI